MRMTTLVKLFKEKNPEGSIWKHRTRANRFEVSYGGEGSRVYTYYATTVIEMADRLGLIPKIDPYKETDRIVSELLASGSTIGYSRCMDRVNLELQRQGLYVDTKYHGTDEFENHLEVYTLEEDSGGW